MVDNEIIKDFPRLILASQSPRRSELLKGLGLSFEIMPAHIDEQPIAGETSFACVERLAFEKASAVVEMIAPGSVPTYVLGADTVVVLDGEILGKPADKAQAIQFLTRLSGQTHQVLTGYALLKIPGIMVKKGVARSFVTMRKLAPEEARAYVETGEPMDKAGAYALQGEGQKFIREVRGLRSNVIGLPVEELMPALKNVGFAFKPP